MKIHPCEKCCAEGEREEEKSSCAACTAAKCVQSGPHFSGARTRAGRAGRAPG